MGSLDDEHQPAVSTTVWSDHYRVLSARSSAMDADGRSNFDKLLFRRDWSYLFASDLLKTTGTTANR